MIKEQECTEIFEQLSKVLSESRLDWITSQVSEEIRIGKTIQRQIETLKDVQESGFATFGDNVGNFKKGPKATYAVTVEYTSEERLELLIDSVRRAVVNTADMEDYLVRFCESDENRPSKIEFHSDESGKQPRLIDRQALVTRFDATRILAELLESLRSEIRRP